MNSVFVIEYYDDYEYSGLSVHRTQAAARKSLEGTGWKFWSDAAPEDHEAEKWVRGRKNTRGYHSSAALIVEYELVDQD